MESWKIILVALVGAAVLGTATYATVAYATKSNVAGYDAEVVNAYKAWTIKYNKKQSDPDVAAYRLGIFAENFNTIKSHNQDTATYKLGQNQFMDLTNAEFKSTYLGLLPTKKVGATMTDNTTNFPAIDWRTKGVVSPVKDQGQCGSCWAFSTTGSLESLNALKAGSITTFSEQQLVDCSSSYGNMGCNGGLMDYAFEYVEATGITTEANYAYTAVTGTCQQNKIKVAFKNTGYTDITSCNDLGNSLQARPISIGVDAETWQFYSGGVFSNCGTQLDHGVLAVGIDSSSNWIVKNSWGTSWGEQGYITLKSGNTCGICNTASYPTA